MSGNDMVDVSLRPARSFERVKDSFVLTAAGEQDLLLPAKLTELTLEDDGSAIATEVRIPRWLAEDRGLLAARNSRDNDVTFEDWCLLGATLAFLFRGETINDAVWEGGKVANAIRRERMVRE